jgi:hypothetical protein
VNLNAIAEELLMSAYLDKSQGVTFVYSNIHELYLKAKNSKLDSPYVAERATEQPRVIKAAEAKVEAFQPKELKTELNERPFPVPMGVREAEEKAKRLNMRPVANLQKNLNELTDAHDKLRFLLQELESLTKKKN